MILKKKGLAGKLKELFKLGKNDGAFFEDLEEILIEGDIGVDTSVRLVEELKERIRRDKLKNNSDFLDALKDLLMSCLKIEPLLPEPDKLNLFLILGVNGVGKTTTIAKLAYYYRKNGIIRSILLSAGDTFRAAAIDQLVLWGKRLKLPVVRQSPGADPGAVIFDSITSARAKGAELVLVDTAGRLHNKAHLVRELVKIDKVVTSRIGGGNYKKILVLDATTGQNAMRQAEVFHEAVGVDSIILAKYDSTARGGIVITISKNLGLPFSFMGIGEKLDSIQLFDKDSYLESLIGRQ